MSSLREVLIDVLEPAAKSIESTDVFVWSTQNSTPLRNSRERANSSCAGLFLLIPASLKEFVRSGFLMNLSEVWLTFRAKQLLFCCFGL